MLRWDKSCSYLPALTRVSTRVFPGVPCTWKCSVVALWWSPLEAGHVPNTNSCFICSILGTDRKSYWLIHNNDRFCTGITRTCMWVSLHYQLKRENVIRWHNTLANRNEYKEAQLISAALTGWGFFEQIPALFTFALTHINCSVFTGAGRESSLNIWANWLLHLSSPHTAPCGNV